MITTITYTAVSFLIAMFSSWIGSLIALRPLGKPPPVFWVDRARLAYPARQTAAKNPLFLCMLLGLMAYGWRNKSEFHLTAADIGAMIISTYVGGIIIALLTEKRVCGTMFRWKSWVGYLGFRLFVAWTPLLLAFFVTVKLLPNSVNLQAILVLVIALAIFLFGATGGGHLIACRIRLVRPASPRLAAIVADATTRTGIKTRGAYEITSSFASAMAIPGLETSDLFGCCWKTTTDAELTAVCVHELAHLQEPWTILAMRTLRGTVLFLPFLLMPWWNMFSGLGAYCLLCGFLFALWSTGSLARRMEVHADLAGRNCEGEAGTYARTLEKY